MEPTTTPSQEDKVSLLNSLSFIHQKLMTVQYYPDEFQSADKALKLIIKLATQIDEELKTAQEASQELSKDV